jgi:pyruvoyl-dependent arginine decarboxylase (PvlArgDC)
MDHIRVVNGTGTARLELSAYHMALFAAGTSGINLVPLSSVVPQIDKPVVEESVTLSYANQGCIVYVVEAKEETRQVGSWAYAGIGWMQTSFDHTGFFVEHHDVFEGQEEGRAIIEQRIRMSLEDMMQSTIKKHDPIKWVIRGIRCEEGPVAAVVQALYKIEPGTERALFFKHNAQRQVYNLGYVIENALGYEARKDIRAGERVLVMNGSWSGQQEKNSIRVREKSYFTPAPEQYQGTVLRTSEQPNLFLNTDWDDRPNFFALRDIKKGELLTYHQGMHDPAAFESLPSEMKKHLVENRLVASYLLKHNV